MGGEELSHSLPFGLPWGRGSIAYFAQRPANKLVVFIHGFGGSAIKTWRGMDKLLNDPCVANADVIFYGYRSLAAPANNSATLFREFLSNAAELTEPWRNALRRGGAMGGRGYQDILVIAHSLGAPVSRRALLDATRAGAGWTKHTRTLLFGPAHVGTRLTELASMLRSHPGSLLMDILTFARFRSPVLNDLAEGSDFLKTLAADSRKALKAGTTNPVVAEAVIFGERENVVITKPFCDDPLSLVWQDEDHCSVCRTVHTLPAVSARI